MDIQEIQSTDDTYARIQAMTGIFDQLREIKLEKAAATYYTILIEDKFPTEFKKIRLRAKAVLTKPPKLSDLQKGRSELLKEGMIAEVFFVDDDNKDFKFGEEMFLPVDPLTIWEAHRNRRGNKLIDEPFISNKNQVMSLSKAYHDKYRKYGLGIQKGRITISFTKNWGFYTIANIFNVQPDLNLDFLFGSLGSFKTELNVYHDLLKNGLKIRVIFDNIRKEDLQKPLEYKDKYPNNIEFKHMTMPHLTIRRIIFGNEIALDGRRILMSDAQKNLYKNKELPYTGTIYTRPEDVSQFKENFQIAWDNAKDL